jgi:hypothetical protein
VSVASRRALEFAKRRQDLGWLLGYPPPEPP